MNHEHQVQHHKTALKIAALAEVDPRTAMRALEHGIEAVKGYVTRARLARAFAELGLDSKLGKEVAA